MIKTFYIYSKKKMNILILNLIILSLINCEEKITVHILSHSHDDPGWIKTFDQYYEDQVEKILNNVVYSLKKEKSRKFIYSEISFFRKWYESSNDTIKNDIKNLIKEKRFEFVNGGFVMEDNAVSHFRDGVSQLRLGLEFLKENFNITPKIVWALDQFGYSMAHTYFYKKFGFNRVVLNRISQNIVNDWFANKDLDFIWNLFNMNKTKILTHIIFDYYCPPSSIRPFCDDYLISSLDNLQSLKSFASNFTKDIKREMKGYKHHHYALYFGCDFTFTETEVNFINIEKFMNYINNSPDFQNVLELKYSTVNEFFDEFEKELKEKDEYKNLKEYNEDFFPYIDQYFLTWTGYFTSRPYMKGKARESSILYDILSILNTEYLLQYHKNNDFFSFQEYAQKAIAISQHHDAMPGTGKSFVHEDYIDFLNKGDSFILNKSQEILEDIIKQKNIKICLSNGKVNLSCKYDFLNFDIKNKLFYFGVYNPGFNGKILFTIEFDISNENVNFNLLDYRKKEVDYNFICIPEYKCYLNFLFDFDRAFAFYHFTINNIEIDKRIIEKKQLSDNVIKIKHDHFLVKNFEYNSKENTFNLEFYNEKNKNYSFSISHNYFSSSTGGAYVSSLNYASPNQYKIDNSKSFYVENSISTNILLKTEKSSLLILIYGDPVFIQIISILDPRPREKVSGSTDIFLNINSNLNSKGIFYTDSNGIKMQERNNSKSKNIQDNLFPIGRAISIKDEDKKIILYNDRPEGGTSLKDGNLIVILNRFTSTDDNKGCDESLYEKESTSVYFESKQIIYFSNGFDEILVNYLANNYFTNNVLIYYSDNYTLLNNYFEKDYEKYSILNQIFIYTDKIKMNIFYISKKRILVQFFNEYDTFFEGNLKHENFSNVLTIHLKRKDIKILECEINGFNCIELIASNSYSSVDQFVHYKLSELEFKIFEIVF